jgi:hypothetical protein
MLNYITKAGTHKDLMATSGEYLRIWEVGEGTKSVNLKARLFNVIKIQMFRQYYL